MPFLILHYTFPLSSRHSLFIDHRLRCRMELTVDLAKDYEALGGAYNAFSLNENGGSLPLAIERVGQASDGLYLSLQDLVPPPPSPTLYTLLSPITTPPSQPPITTPHHNPLSQPPITTPYHNNPLIVTPLTHTIGPRPLLNLLRAPRRILPIRRNPTHSPALPPPKGPAAGTHAGHPGGEIGAAAAV